MRRLIVLLIALLPLFGPGCSSGPGGKGEQVEQAGTLQEVADILRGGTKPNGKGPSKVSELTGSQSLFPRGYQAIKSGEVVVIWGVGVKGEEEAAKGGGDIVAYEKDAPNNGGYVVLTSGEVKKMSASEFASAPKAK